MTKKMIVGAYSTKIAKKVFPDIYQEVGFSRMNDNWKYDIPCEINFGDFVLPKQPVVYYYIRQDDEYYYVCYCFYHYLDYTNCPPGKIFGGEHRSDFEGALIRIKRFNPDGRMPERDSIITIAHNKYIYSQHVWRILIKAGSHAIYPGGIPSRSYLTITDNIRLINMDKLPQSYWRTVEAEFKESGVNLPWTWSHQGKYKGWFWNQPDQLFEEMAMSWKSGLLGWSRWLSKNTQ